MKARQATRFIASVKNVLFQKFETPTNVKPHTDQRNACQGASNPSSAIANILDEYVTKTPSDQNALDIFAGEWSSQMPSTRPDLKAGDKSLFEDARITWAEQQLGGFKDLNVLELGPLEAGHTYQLEKMDAKSVLAIEANTRSYLKCLIVKEIIGLGRSRFLLGDFVPYLRETNATFDVCLASGVLYHMVNPAELIYLISKAARSVIIWTHYYDHNIVRNNPNLSHKFSEPMQLEFRGFNHVLHKYLYKDALNWAGFCGGSLPHSYWMSREDILACLKWFGFNDVRVGIEAPDHPNGPSFCVAGLRS